MNCGKKNITIEILHSELADNDMVSALKQIVDVHDAQ